MKKNRLDLRLSDRRMNKLRLYSVNQDKSMTRIIEDFIDTLPEQDIGKNSTTPQPVKPTA
ncbi:hypothetical protein [Calothrix rhizosoleniae]|uniref:hypothetical protein n=1 Tax=Calothrix rhizosoleniae TaxID=888997 RepID=UPI000B4A12D1|nr:hypothetical protein [Calothrix rhizosoleniae]